MAVAGADGRVVAAEGAEAADALRHLVEAAGMPLVGHEIKPLLVARFADDLEGPPTPVAFDTQIAAYILNAALRSQTIADVVAENLDQILPPRDGAARRPPGPGSRRCRRSPSASRSSGASPRSGWTACSATSSCR